MTIQPIHIITLSLSICIIALALCPPIAQDLQYHQFADRRTFCNIPNFWNVVSNLPFLIVGAIGLRQTAQNWNNLPNSTTKWIASTLHFGIFIVSFGSAYYHAAPDNHSLIWDRLPMTLIFMSLFALLLYDFLGERAGRITYWIAVPFGIWSIWYWQYTESIGAGDLRPYAFVQFFPMIATLSLIAFSSEKLSYTKLMAWLLGLYVIAKGAEHYDKFIFDTLQCWSGHTLKHLISAGSLVYALQLVAQWTVKVNRFSR
jgi:Ceramidase